MVSLGNHTSYLIFLTPRIFALEFMRQRLCAEEEHFGASKKSSNIKFPLKVGPFIFKTIYFQKQKCPDGCRKVIRNYGFPERTKNQL